MIYNDVSEMESLELQVILEYNSKSDCELVNLWKLHQKMCQKINDYNWIAYHVCEDLLRQRGNTYMQYIDACYSK